MEFVLFLLIGYLSGSVMFAKIFGKLIAHKDITIDSEDHNPGAFNAFKNGGFLCGTLTIICELLKGAIPVGLYFLSHKNPAQYEYFIIVAPLLGHMFPLFNNFNGGKGIAVSFGALIGLIPITYKPLLVQAIIFIIFSVIIVVKSNFYKTLFTYIFVPIVLIFLDIPIGVFLSSLTVSSFITVKLLRSKEERKLEIKFL